MMERSILRRKILIIVFKIIIIISKMEQLVVGHAEIEKKLFMQELIMESYTLLMLLMVMNCGDISLLTF